MRKNVLLISFILVLLSGCASLPSVSDDTGMIAFPILKSTKDSSAYFIYYKVYYSKSGVERQGKETYIRIGANNGSFALHRLEPGAYDIYAIESVYSSNNKVARRTVIEKRFECYPGAITILPNCFDIMLRNGSDGKARQHFDLKVTDEATYLEVNDKLLKLKNVEAWEIRY